MFDKMYSGIRKWFALMLLSSYLERDVMERFLFYIDNSKQTRYLVLHEPSLCHKYNFMSNGGFTWKLQDTDILIT